MLPAVKLGQHGIAFESQQIPARIFGAVMRAGAEGCSKEPAAHLIALPLPFDLKIGGGSGFRKQVAVQPVVSIQFYSSLFDVVQRRDGASSAKQRGRSLPAGHAGVVLPHPEPF